MPSESTRSVLNSPALGSDLPGLIKRCGDATRPAQPAAPGEGLAFGTTFSGGGFRATFTAAGVVRYLADAGLLSNLRYSSSVSGGSVLNGVLAMQWPLLREDGYSTSAVDRHVIGVLAERVTSESLKSKLLKNMWRATFSKTRTDVLAWAFDKWFFHGLTLDQLDPEVRWILNAANMSTGVRFGFERDVVGDYVTGLARTEGRGIPVSLAVATSAAVPGAFAPVNLKDIEFPCWHGKDIELLDGGAYDNTGIEAIDSEHYRDVFTVTAAAGGVLVTGAYGKTPIVRDLSRANSLLYRQSRTLRTRDMVGRFKAAKGIALDESLPQGARRGLLFALGSSVEPSYDAPTTPEYSDFIDTFPEHRTFEGKDLAFMPTVFDQLSQDLVNRLVYRGWWLTGASMALYHPELSPATSETQPPPI